MSNSTLQRNTTSYLHESDWDDIRRTVSVADEKREEVIKRSRDLQKLAKQAIYSLHRQDADKAMAQLDAFRKIAAELSPLFETHPLLRTQGAFSAALEEFAEARIFQSFLSDGSIPRLSDMRPLVDTEEYLGGLLDFTGELGRWAVARATARDKESVSVARDVVDQVLGQFLSLDLRNTALRRKYDALKYTLKNMESLLYELSLAEGMGYAREARALEAAPPAAPADTQASAGDSPADMTA